MLTRKTKQQSFIIENLKNRFDHPTNLQIYNEAKLQGFKIGEVTIYRILNNLVNEGVVCKIVTKDNIAHFDYIRDNHIHIVCNNCNQIFDKNFSCDSQLSEIIKDFHISIQDVVLYGFCKECAKELKINRL